jgi:type VI secretion system FHA domain protein
MALRFRIISDHRRLLGERSTVVFDVAGGTIGRSADNDWVLPDTQRYVSAHHARIHFRDGSFYLEDTSTNGVFVNESEQALGKQPYCLQNGDVLRIGQYQLVVALEPAAAPVTAPARAGARSAIANEAVPTHISVLQNIGGHAQTDLGAALKLDDLLVSDGSGSQPRLHDAYGQAVAVRAGPSPAAAPTETEEEAVARRIERLARAAAKARDAKAAVLPALYDVQSGLQAFCRGAGIDAERLPPDSQTRLMHLVGQLFREALVGLKDLERARREIHNRFRIELPADPDDPRPSLARTAIEELVVQILTQHESRRLDAILWLREILDGAKDHEKAAAESMREAFLEFIGRFDPAELEARFQRAARRGKNADNGQARYWELFVEFYRNLTEMPADHLPHTFVEAFATAYKKLRLAPKAE